MLAITANIPETAEDRTVSSELLIAPAASGFSLFALLARPFAFVFFVL